MRTVESIASGPAGDITVADCATGGCARLWCRGHSVHTSTLAGEGNSYLDTGTKRSRYRQGLTTIEKALGTSGSMVLGLYLYSASLMLKHSQTLRPEYRKIKSHVIGTPAIVSLMPGISQTELAQLLSCERATAGLQVAECVRLGWIKRVVSAQDKRRYELQITAKGERMLAEIRQIIARHEAEFLAPLSVDERKSLRELLAKLIS